MESAEKVSFFGRGHSEGAGLISRLRYGANSGVGNVQGMFMKKTMEHYIDFPTLNGEAKVVLILTAVCQYPAIMKKIYTMWTNRFCP